MNGPLALGSISLMQGSTRMSHYKLNPRAAGYKVSYAGPWDTGFTIYMGKE